MRLQLVGVEYNPRQVPSRPPLVSDVVDGADVHGSDHTGTTSSKGEPLRVGITPVGAESDFGEPTRPMARRTKPRARSGSARATARPPAQHLDGGSSGAGGQPGRPGNGQVGLATARSRALRGPGGPVDGADRRASGSPSGHGPPHPSRLTTTIDNTSQAPSGPARHRDQHGGHGSPSRFRAARAALPCRAHRPPSATATRARDDRARGVRRVFDGQRRWHGTSRATLSGGPASRR